jgi:Zn-dependent peptidase ImmA (M78 family)
MVIPPEEGLSSPPEINLARRIHERFKLTVPVDVIELAKKYADVTFEILPIEADGVCYDLKRSGVRPKIVLNRLRSKTRLRFTLAHELGHVLIPWHAGIMVDDLSSPVWDADGHYKMEGEANRFASELLLPSKWMIDQISRMEDPLELASSISQGAQVSPATAVIKLLSLLESGHIYAETDDAGIIVASGRSPGTIASGLGRGKPLDEEARFLAGVKSWVGLVGVSYYHWWNIPNKIPIPILNDIRDWRKILVDLLTDSLSDSVERQHAKQSVNGVIGAMNGRLSQKSAEELYAALKQRFDSKKHEEPMYEKITRHPDFEVFLAKRVSDLKA